MLVLAFDTSSPAVTVALNRYAVSVPEDLAAVSIVAGRQVLAEREAIATNKHGELLAPLIAEVLASVDTTPRDLGAIGIGLGPGPFTGLRVGIVTAKAMADALDIPTYGQCSLDVIARHYATDDEAFAVLTDARRKQVYWRLYDRLGHPLGDPEISVPSDLAEILSGQVGRLVGAGAELYSDTFANFTVVEGYSYPRAAELSWMVGARLLEPQSSDDLVPLYLRRPDAQLPGPPKQVTPA